ncbi:MAG: hypothetical protein Tsb005_12640 [Gammaproteobacteria bacterium]
MNQNHKKEINFEETIVNHDDYDEIPTNIAFESTNISSQSTNAVSKKVLQNLSGTLEWYQTKELWLLDKLFEHPTSEEIIKTRNLIVPQMAVYYFIAISNLVRASYVTNTDEDVLDYTLLITVLQLVPLLITYNFFALGVQAGQAKGKDDPGATKQALVVSSWMFAASAALVTPLFLNVKAIATSFGASEVAAEKIFEIFKWSPLNSFLLNGITAAEQIVVHISTLLPTVASVGGGIINDVLAYLLTKGYFGKAFPLSGPVLSSVILSGPILLVLALYIYNKKPYAEMLRSEPRHSLSFARFLRLFGQQLIVGTTTMGNAAVNTIAPIIMIVVLHYCQANSNQLKVVGILASLMNFIKAASTAANDVLGAYGARLIKEKEIQRFLIASRTAQVINSTVAVSTFGILAAGVVNSLTKLVGGDFIRGDQDLIYRASLILFAGQVLGSFGQIRIGEMRADNDNFMPFLINIFTNGVLFGVIGGLMFQAYDVEGLVGAYAITQFLQTAFMEIWSRYLWQRNHGRDNFIPLQLPSSVNADFNQRGKSDKQILSNAVETKLNEQTPLLITEKLPADDTNRNDGCRFFKTLTQIKLSIFGCCHNFDATKKVSTDVDTSLPVLNLLSNQG